MPGGSNQTQLGVYLDHMADCVRTLKVEGANIGVCADTAHLVAAGFDIDQSRDAYDEFWRNWIDHFGEPPTLLHVNGAANLRGRGVDGHTTLNGKITGSGRVIHSPVVNPEMFAWLRTDKRFELSTHILETPPDWHHRDLPAYLAAQPNWRTD